MFDILNHMAAFGLLLVLVLLVGLEFLNDREFAEWLLIGLKLTSVTFIVIEIVLWCAWYLFK